MPRQQGSERSTTFTISVIPSLIETLDTIAYAEKIPSRSSLIVKILTDWVDLYQSKKKKRA